ncbi:MAG: ABC transporter ATP-binding protein [Parvibaculaceae bacterium]
MSDPQPIISIRGVSKHFGPVAAVDDVSIDIVRGEFFSLLGPSGCGKTTLLRMLAGFEHPTFGEVLIDGQEMAGVPPNRRPTNMVFQSYAIFPHLNVRQNIAYGLRNAKLTKDEMESRVKAALALVRLDNYGEREAHQLSGGQRQRVALARALVLRPKVLLLDEPLGALDKKLREEMQVELRQLQRTVGITFVFVTHDQEEALTLSDRIAVMSRGKVLQVEPSSRLYEAPNCREVAEFIGSMNFIEGTLEGNGTVSARLGAFAVPLGNEKVEKGGRVFLAIRPEKLTLTEQRPGNGANAVEGVVTAVTYLGDRSHFLVRVEGQDRPFAVAMQNAQRAPSATRLENSKVWLAWPPEAGLLLTH